MRRIDGTGDFAQMPPCPSRVMEVVSIALPAKLAVNPVIESGNGSISHFLRYASQRAESARKQG